MGGRLLSQPPRDGGVEARFHRPRVGVQGRCGHRQPQPVAERRLHHPRRQQLPQRPPVAQRRHQPRVRQALVRRRPRVQQRLPRRVDAAVLRAVAAQVLCLFHRPPLERCWIQEQLRVRRVDHGVQRLLLRCVGEVDGAQRGERRVGAEPPFSHHVRHGEGHGAALALLAVDEDRAALAGVAVDEVEDGRDVVPDVRAVVIGQPQVLEHQLPGAQVFVGDMRRNRRCDLFRHAQERTDSQRIAVLLVPRVLDAPNVQMIVHRGAEPPRRVAQLERSELRVDQ
mmetsp:Transcript_19184/g.59588  ORF Transcript_19184/g.59588 Transcript_19184/m.59588 type:complete len:282 (+) Transcript_19184:831-1676(+)